jgi:hypothetical protein
MTTPTGADPRMAAAIEDLLDGLMTPFHIHVECWYDEHGPTFDNNVWYSARVVSREGWDDERIGVPVVLLGTAHTIEQAIRNAIARHPADAATNEKE